MRAIYYKFKYGLNFYDARQLVKLLQSTDKINVFHFSIGQVATAMRKHKKHTIRGHCFENGKLYALTKISIDLVKSPVLKGILRAIVDHNEKRN